MEKRLAHWRSPLAATLILVLLIAAASFAVTGSINRIEEESSFQRLADEAAEFADGLELNMAADRRQLELLAALAADDMEPDLEELRELLDTYHGTGTFFSRIEVLLPGDVVLAQGGAETDVSGRLSFEEEAALGAHVSDRETDLEGGGYVVRHYVPIERGGETVAMLCGVIELGTLNRDLPYSPYGGEASVYVIDGATGDFLIDTWHAELGNIWETGARQMAEGYDNAQLSQGLIDGESNYVVFVSNTTGEYLYFYYTPLNINRWRVALSVPEDLVFSGARNIRSLLDALLIAEGAVFLVYILWMVRYVRRETGEKQRRLDALNYIYDVEKLLFNAHEHQENISRSLEVIARMLPARCVAFSMTSDEGSDPGYLWEEGGETALGRAHLRGAARLAECFSGGHGEISANSRQEVRALLPNVPEGMDDLVAIPVEDADGVIRGVLSASGLKKRTDCAAMLKSVAFSFVMLSNNMRTYSTLRRRGEHDVLTGLYNRNRYEADLPRLGESCRVSLGCVFVDANGLHELNNSRGHEAGDGMLRAVANELRVRFGQEHSYRIGGDEFVAFTADEPETNLRIHCRAMVAGLESCGYFVSAGTSWAEAPVEDIESLVKSAEAQMYDAKREYYRRLENDRRAR